MTRFGARETSVANLIKQKMGIFIVEDTDGSVTSNFMDLVSSLYSIDTQSRLTVILDDDGIRALTTGTRFVSSFHLQQRFDEARKVRDADNNQLTVERVERVVQAALSDRPRTDEPQHKVARLCHLTESLERLIVAIVA